jgi:membrane-bound lytic murein transglycosylase B
MRSVKVLSAAIVLSSVLIAPSLAASCNPPGGFDAFLAAFKRDAAAKGVSARGLSALNGVTLDPAVLAADKRQGVFKQTFEEFSGRMISRDRMTKGLRLLQVLAPRCCAGPSICSVCRAR